jgi:hypothetical protein
MCSTDSLFTTDSLSQSQKRVGELTCYYYSLGVLEGRVSHELTCKFMHNDLNKL